MRDQEYLIEIGSFFEWHDLKEEIQPFFLSCLPKGEDRSFLFSGRSAIELALEDMAGRKRLKTVLMPSYSCDSMKQPFINAGLDIEYYKVTYAPGRGLVYDINYSSDCDVLMILDYFGLMDSNLNPIIERFQNKGSLVIEDITHSVLSDRASSKADYLILSIRKWLPIASGGYIVKNKGSLIRKPSKPSGQLVLGKLEAMKHKKRFLNGEELSKDDFINLSNRFEERFRNIDSTYQMDPTSLSIVERIDIEEIKRQRKVNGEKLYNGLKKFDFLNLLIPEVDFSKSCPLFVPIIMENDKRNSLRNFLINSSVYCPIHWPRNIYPERGIEEMELSLICDQRYGLNHMDYILEQINNWKLLNF